MAASTSPAERARRHRRAGAGLLALAALLASCQLLPAREPSASDDVLEALYAGMKRAQDHPVREPPDPRAEPNNGPSTGPREDRAP
jgi:hypothetical protein